MADDKKGLIEHFATVAGVEEERARFFLEMTNWNLDLALTNFFESNEDSDTEVVARPRDPTPPRGTDHSARHVPLPSGFAAQGGKGAAKPATSSKIASLSTLRKDEKSDESSEEEEGQAYYAGGSERTGQQILGPPKKKTNPDKLISGLFTAAKEHGAEEVEPEGGGGAMSAAGPRVVPFQGRAYRLGDPSTQSEVIEGPQVHQKRKVDVAMKFWRNGFSLNDGPLREFGEPQNTAFVDAIRRNEVPRELIEQARGGEVNLSLEDHRNEDYVAPKKVIQSFAGIGHRLGSPTDAGSNMETGAASSSSSCAGSSAPNAAVASSSAASASSTEADAARNIRLDASQPITNLQIRLTDGSRLVAKFNHSHTVSDVRKFIVSARPQLVGANFVLMTTFPNREISDESQTLAAANLLNAVLVQKSK